jgi:hypothetical protein
MKYYETVITEIGNRPIKASYRVMATRIGFDPAYLHKVLTGKVVMEKTKFYKLMDKLQKAGF